MKGREKRFRKPTTRLDDLVNFYKDLKAAENLAFVRLSAGIFDENKSLFFLKEQKICLEERYSKMLNPKDRYYFESLRELKSFLESCGFNKERIQESIKHEKAHYREALRFGFNLNGFTCWLAIDDGRKDYVCSTLISCHRMPVHDLYKKASRAPRKLSFIDEMAV